MWRSARSAARTLGRCASVRGGPPGSWRNPEARPAPSRRVSPARRTSATRSGAAPHRGTPPAARRVLLPSAQSSARGPAGDPAIPRGSRGPPGAPLPFRGAQLRRRGRPSQREIRPPPRARVSTPRHRARTPPAALSHFRGSWPRIPEGPRHRHHGPGGISGRRRHPDHGPGRMPTRQWHRNFLKNRSRPSTPTARPASASTDRHKERRVDSTP